MQIVFLFILFFICRIFQSIYTKKASTGIEGRAQLLTYTAFQYLVCTLLSVPILFVSGSVDLSPAAAGSALLGGIAMFCCSMCTLMALRKGAFFVLTTLASSVSIIIPTVASIFLFDEPMSIWQVLGIAVLIYGASLLLGFSKDMYKQFSVKSLPYLLGIFAAEGMTMLAQKCFSGYGAGGNVAAFSFLAFGTAAVLTGLMSGVEIHRTKSSISQVMHKKLWVCGMVLAVMLFVIMYLATIAAALVPAVILYSLSAGGTLIVSLLVSSIVFKEKATGKNLVGLGISIAALIVINTL